MKLRKTGGRKCGVPNKKTKNLMDKCDELGCDPFEILLRFAQGDWKGLGYKTEQIVTHVTEGGMELVEDVISAELRAQCAKEAAQYIYPKRKALEVSQDPESEGFRIIVEDYSKK